MSAGRAAIVDYRLGNLFSVKQACAHAGIEAMITDQPSELAQSDLIILPGVGAFGDAMANLNELGLAEAIKQAAAGGKPVVGICLGMQLMMSQSDEFGRHIGLDLIPGRVVRFEAPRENGRTLKVPQVGWNRIQPSPDGRPWEGSPLAGIAPGEFMYFVHSFYAAPKDESLVLSLTIYGHMEFCSAVQKENIFACQFHPEKSGPAGLRVYHNLAGMVADYRKRQRESA